jgi:pyruvate,water dikinase
MEHWDSVKDPWFNDSAGTGFYHTHKVWIEHPEIPLGFIRNYVAALEAGEDLSRPIDDIRKERDRIVSEYEELLGSDEDRQAFAQKLGLARVVFPYVENHNFYVEHWSHSVFYRKMKELGDVFVKEGFFADRDDIFYLKRDEVNEALWDMYSAWAVGTKPRGPVYWNRELDRRKGIIEALRKWSPPPALGSPRWSPSPSPSCCGASPRTASPCGSAPTRREVRATCVGSPPHREWPRALPG